MHRTKRAIVAAVGVACTGVAMPSFAEDPFSRVHVAVNRHEFHGSCPTEVIFTGSINFAMPHPRGFTKKYSWDRSDGAKGRVHVVRPEPSQHTLVVRDTWRLGGHGQKH